MKSLGVPMFGPLNNQRHAPSGKRGDCVPFKAAPDRNPREAIQRKDNESCRARSKHPQLCQPMTDILERHFRKRS